MRLSSPSDGSDDEGKERGWHVYSKLFLIAVAVWSVGQWGIWRYVPSSSQGPTPLNRPSASPKSARAASMPARRPWLIAGSGSNLPLMHVMLEAFQRQDKEARKRLRLRPSIGSTGGVRAVADGVVTLGLVSRPLRKAERRLGLTVRPYARVAVVFAASPTTEIASLRWVTVLAMIRGTTETWPDRQRLALFLRERGDSGHRAIAAVRTSFVEASRLAYQQRRWPVVYRDRAMQEALMRTPGALGVTDLGSVLVQKLPLRIVALDGVMPSATSLRAGRYPFFKTLSFVYRGTLPPAASRFVRFVGSPQGHALSQRYSYLPWSSRQKGGQPQ